MAEETTTKKKRGPRRNFAKIVTDLQTYCEVSIAVIESINSTSPTDHFKGQLDALKAVQARLRGTNG